MASYWEINRSRVTTRRKVLGGAAGLGLAVGAAGLVGCGGGSSDKSSSSSSSDQGKFATPKDTTSSAKPGGIYKSFAASDTVSLDAIGGTSASSRQVGNMAYSRLVQFNTGINKPSTGEIEPHLAASWELLNGGSTLVMKLRPEAKFDQRAPTNGKQVTSADVAYSWEKFAKVGIQRAELIQAANPTAPFPSTVETPDPSTVVFKLAFPWSPALAMLATGTQFVVMPTEADGKFDPKSDVRGSGAWTIEYKPSVGTEYRKNPNWWAKDRPFLDGISSPLVPEYATQLSQFRAGGIWDGVVRQDDILQTKADIPQLQLFRQNDFIVNTGSLLFFGYQPASPYKDDRIRKAVSMTLDRDLYIQIVFGTDKYKAAGLDTPVQWNSHISSAWGRYWLDPKGNNFGPNGKFFQHDPTEAKKLLTAAGFTNGIQSTSTVSSIQTSNTVPLLLGMLDDAGIKNRRETVDYSTVWLPKFFYARGDFDGLSINAQYNSPEIGVELAAAYHSTGARTHQPAGTDPTLDKMIEDQFKEFDDKKRVPLIQDIQRYLADKMYMVFGPGDALPYQLTWPYAGNYGVFRPWPGSAYSDGSQVLTNYWITDDQKRQG